MKPEEKSGLKLKNDNNRYQKRSDEITHGIGSLNVSVMARVCRRGHPIEKMPPSLSVAVIDLPRREVGIFSTCKSRCVEAGRRLDKIPIRFAAGLSRQGSLDDASALIELRRVHCHLLSLSFSLPEVEPACRL